MQIQRKKRAEPLTPTVALGRGPCALRLLERAARLPEPRQYSAAAAPDLFFLIGAGPPWVDGVEYFGRVGNVFLPTAVEHAPEEFFARRIYREYGSVIVLEREVIETAEAAPLVPEAIPELRRIIAGES